MNIIKIVIVSACTAVAFCLTAAAEIKTGKVMGVPYYPAGTSLDAFAQKRCTLDFKYPLSKNLTNFPTIVWFHGGGLRPPPGPAGFNTRLPERFAQATVNYRCFDEGDGKITADDILNDASAAVAWAMKHVAEYGGDPKRVYVSGSSAGGYLTFMVAMNPELLAKWGFRNTDLAGAISCSGQGSTHFNVKKHSGDPRFQSDAGSRFLMHVDKYAPMYYCDQKELPPIVSLVGEGPWEWGTRAEENKVLIASLRRLGHKKVWYVSLPYVNHARTAITCPAYIELFIDGRFPEPLENTAAKDVR